MRQTLAHCRSALDDRGQTRVITAETVRHYRRQPGLWLGVDCSSGSPQPGGW
ncbi:MAG: hypothetical protein K0V04_06580 [Deltaproteobacteria bacterium]|nr:hypothetical protein [Deltaproteobacteria bacterium]